MSVGTVCIKHFKFACMTILSPETVSLVLFQSGPLRICKCRLFQISPRMLKFWPKMHKNANRGNHISKIFSGEIPPNPLTRVAIPPLVLSPSTGTLNVTAISCVLITCSHNTEDRVATPSNLTDMVLSSLCSFFFSRSR